MSKSYSHNVNEVINRLKTTLNVDSDAALARIINISPPSLSNWRKRNSIDYDLLIGYCNENNIDLNTILFGKDQSSHTVNEPSPAYNPNSLPLIPLDAMAGYGQGDLSLPLGTERYLIPEFNKKADFLIRISGTSMSPKYFNGDIVACKKIPTKTFLQWGKVYILDTIQGALCKRVFPSKKESHIICRSDNTDLYPDFEIALKEVRSLAIIIGVIRLE